MPAVGYTAELARILALPRRPQAIDPALVTELTSLLKTPAGTMSLRPVQALALHDLGVYGGLFAPIGVGEGKTLITLLTPYILDAKRPVLLLPAALVEKTERERAELAKHWRIPTNIRLVSYTILSLDHYADFLERYDPDCIVCDEAHRLKNKRAAVTRRIARFMHEKPMTPFAALTGTPIGARTSIRDIAHLLLWTLKLSAPVPTKVEEIEEWASALDGFVDPMSRRDPGALLQFCTEDERRTYQPHVAARHGFRRRLVETPGVVSTAGEGDVARDIPIRVRGILFNVKPITDSHIATLREEWVTPDGWPLTNPPEVWATVRQLALGLHYLWDPRPPPEWMLARKNWGAFVRETLSRSRTLDTEKQVADACDQGRLDATALNAWREIAPSYTPCVKPAWHDSSAIELCVVWMKQKPGIVWTEHGFFAEELSRRSGFPYFGAQGKTADGLFIDDALPGSSAVVSIDANREGRNLQRLWSRALVTCMPAAADWVEQLIGRLHRTGQTAPEVEIDVLLGCREHYDACLKALDGAQTTRELTGKEQRLLMASVDLPSEGAVSKLFSARWQR